MGKNWFHQIVDPWTKPGWEGSGIQQIAEAVNPFHDPLKEKVPGIQAQIDAAPTALSGVDLARQLINAGYGSSLAEYGFTPDDVIAELGNQGVDLTKKGLKPADIIAGLNSAGLESDFKYKMTHKAPTPPLSSAAANQLLSTIAGYQRPFLDSMKAQANYGGALVGDIAKYLSPRSQAAYGDLTKAYQGQANALADLIPAGNAAVLMNLTNPAAAVASGGSSLGNIPGLAAAIAGGKG